MKKYIQAYMALVNKFIDEEIETADPERFAEVLQEFEIKIAYFQHERFIHLIVTVLFALLEMGSLYVCLIAPSLPILVFCGMFLILLVPYVMHYYFLENSVQEMYKMRDKIKASKTRKKS